MTQELLMGNEALALGALRSGVRVAAGYPGTPSSELIETISKRYLSGKAHGVHVQWSTNEKAALELVAAASYSGARVLYTCKQVGLNVASDALMSLIYIGIKGGCVLYVADDPGPISSQTEQDTRRFASFAKLPVFDPASVDQGVDMMEAAFQLSERYKTPVILRPTTRICHASTFLDFPDETYAQEIPEEGFVKDPKWVIFPKRAYEGHGEINKRLRDIAHDFSRGALGDFNPIEVVEAANSDRPGDEKVAAPNLGILCGGASYMYVKEATGLLECRAKESSDFIPTYKIMQVGTPYPFPHEKFAEFAEGLDEIFVAEELDHVLEDEALMFAGRNHCTYKVRGKLDFSAPDRGENSTENMFESLAKFFGLNDSGLKDDVAFASSAKNLDQDDKDLDANIDLPMRPPVLCSGCPHRGSFLAIKKALSNAGHEAIHCGDIGCYTLGNAQPLNAIDTCLCMGAGITMAQGFSIVQPDKKHIAYIGDSTFFASGLTGVANAVYNQHDITIVVLDNDTTAMTGAQPHPGTGDTLMGVQSKKISIPRVLEAMGVECIKVANPMKMAEAVKAAQEAIDFPGPAAIVYEYPCVKIPTPKLSKGDSSTKLPKDSRC